MHNSKPSAAEVRWGAKTRDSPETHRELTWSTQWYHTATALFQIWWKMRTNPRLSSALHTLSVAHITILTHVNVCTHTHTCTPALSLPFSLSKNKKKRNKAIHSLLASVQLMIYGYDEGAHLVPIAVCTLPGNSETWLRLCLILSFVTGVRTLWVVNGVTVDSVYPQNCVWQLY